MYKVAQCWDDGVFNDIKVAEICRRHGAKATFNLNPGLNQEITSSGWKFQDFDVKRLGKREFKSVYEGFELASHTMTHPWPSKIELEAFRSEVVDARNYIEDLVQREQRGFAWPFGDAPDASADILREEGFAYGRTTKNAPDILVNADLMKLPVHCHFANPDFDNIWKAAKKTGVFYFWGHSYEMKDDPVLWKRYEEQIRQISADPEAQWVNVVDLVDLQATRADVGNNDALCPDV